MSKSILIYSYLLLFLLLSSCRNTDNEIKSYYVLNDRFETVMKIFDLEIYKIKREMYEMNNDAPDATKDLWNKTTEIHKISENICDYIQSLKESFIEAGGGINERGRLIQDGNRNIVYKLMLEGNKGVELNNKLLKARHKLKLLMKNVASVNGLDEYTNENILVKKDNYKFGELEIHNDTTEKWVKDYFHNVPMICAICYLTSIQNDMKITEYYLLTSIRNSILGGPFEFDPYVPVIKAQRSCLKINDQYKADIFLSMFEPVDYIEVNMCDSLYSSDYGDIKISLNTTTRGSFNIPYEVVTKDYNGAVIFHDSGVFKYDVY